MISAAATLVRKEFLAIVAEVVGPRSDPGMRGFRVGVIQATARGVELRYHGAPTGPRIGPARGYAADRALVIDAAARTVARRGARIARGEAPRIDDPDWIERLRAAHPDLFDCEVSCGPGWSDLLHAMAARLAERDLPVTFEQVKEKYGGLRAYHRGGDDLTEEVVAAFEVLAEGVCETCGAPGIVRRAPGGRLQAACASHV